MTTRHTLTPLRSLTAIAPSGGESYMAKYSESDNELSYGCSGLLTAIEYAQFWKAKLKAERGGVERWNAAIALLVSSGWMVQDG